MLSILFLLKIIYPFFITILLCYKLTNCCGKKNQKKIHDFTKDSDESIDVQKKENNNTFENKSLNISNECDGRTFDENKRNAEDNSNCNNVGLSDNKNPVVNDLSLKMVVTNPTSSKFYTLHLEKYKKKPKEQPLIKPQEQIQAQPQEKLQEKPQENPKNVPLNNRKALLLPPPPKPLTPLEIVIPANNNNNALPLPPINHPNYVPEIEENQNIAPLLPSSSTTKKKKNIKKPPKHHIKKQSIEKYSNSNTKLSPRKKNNKKK